MVTERDAVLRERKAWDECAYRLSLVGTGSAESEQLKNDLYPLPKVTRPRVVNDPSDSTVEWRFENNAGLVWRAVPGFPMWNGVSTWYPKPERVKMWADLLANPTEEVDG